MILKIRKVENPGANT